MSGDQDFLKISLLMQNVSCLDLLWVEGHTFSFLRSKQFGSASLQSGSHAQAVVGGSRGLPWQCPNPPCGAVLEASPGWDQAGPGRIIVITGKQIPPRTCPPLLPREQCHLAVLCCGSCNEWKVSSTPGVSIRSPLTWEPVWQVKVA